MTDNNLAEIFDDDIEPNEEVEVETETEATGEDTEKGEEAEDTNTVEVEEEPADVEPPSTEDKSESVPLAALQAERNKRQEAEAKVAEFEKEPETERPDVLEDQEGAFQHSEAKLNKLVQTERINQSRVMMSEFKPDYEAKEAIFIELAKKDSSLAAQMYAHPSPAKFAYEKAEEHIEYEKFKTYSASDEYKEFLESRKGANTPAGATPAQKRKADALQTPNLSKSTSAELTNTKETLDSLDEMFPDSY